MSESESIFEPLGSHHDRTSFECGVKELDDFLKTKARKERDLGYSSVFVLIDTEHPDVIVGYYTLSAHSIELNDLGERLRKKFPKYPLVPTTLLGRLACSLAFQKKGIGRLLLMEALKAAVRVSKEVGSHAVVVDAINEDAVRFYQKYGFTSILGHDSRLYLPMETIQKLGLE